MFGATLKATNSSFQKGMTFCHSIYVKKVMKLLAFIFEQPSYLACNDKNAFLLLNNLNDINCGHVRKCVKRSIIFWTIYL